MSVLLVSGDRPQDGVLPLCMRNLQDVDNPVEELSPFTGMHGYVHTLQC
jgi:hypothetical protein